MNYNELIDDLNRGVLTTAVAKRAAAAIKELVQLRQLDMAELMRLRRWIEKLEGDNDSQGKS